MPESSPGPFSPIVRRFPLWLLQELAQLLELGRGDLALDFVQSRDCRIGFVSLPSFISNLRFSWRPALSRLILPDQIPIDQTGSADL